MFILVMQMKSVFVENEPPFGVVNERVVENKAVVIKKK